MGDPQLGVAERLDEAVLLSVLSDVGSRNIFALTTLLQRSDLEVISAESGDGAIALIVAPEGPAGRSPAEVC